MKQTPRERNRELYHRAGRTARNAGRPITACPKLKCSAMDTFGAWLEEQWRRGWFEQDDELRQLRLSL